MLFNIFKRKQKIVVFSRELITNFGDPIIGDCCKYLIEKTAKEMKTPVTVSIVNVYSKDENYLDQVIRNNDKFIFPGGGLNSVKFNKQVLFIMKIIGKYPEKEIYFNAIGLLLNNANPKNEELLKKMFNKKQVKQVTTRGSGEKLDMLLKPNKPYPAATILDPAIWVNEAYRINKDASSEYIGIGVIRPEIWSENKNTYTVEQVTDMYLNLVAELDKRGYKWKFFCNGMSSDFEFGKDLITKLGVDEETHLAPKPENCRELVECIAQFKAVIAARLHANIISTSLQIPSIGLVWNEKMHFFAELIEQEERYLSPEEFSDTMLIVDRMVKAIDEGYNSQALIDMKEKTIQTIKNIIAKTPQKK